MKINLKSLSLWILPVIFSSVFEIFFTDFRWYNVQNLVENIVFFILIWIIIGFMKSSNFKLISTKVFYVVFVLFLSIETSFFYLFSTFFSASSLFIFFETNPAETKEFLSFYVDRHLIIYFITMLSFIVIFLLKNWGYAVDFKFKIKPIIRVALFVFLIASLKISGFIIASFPFQLLKGSVSYMYEMQKFSKLKLDKPYGSFENVLFKGDSTSHTFVLIIGESNARRQMGMYGYKRETTPMLSKRKDELIIYTDVISSKAHTIESLQDALIFKNSEDQSESSIIQLFNQAGFKTFWLSNQRPVGIHETLLTKLSKASNQYIYTNTTHYGSVTPFDEVLLPHLDKALDDKASKKLIVLNFLATHGNYGLRYPPEFNHFTSNPPTKFPAQDNFEVINHYHNSIYYVDYLVNSIIEKVSTFSEKSYVLYFSDHGEEVFFDRDFAGHNDSDIPTKSMFEIPFFVWTSAEFDSAYSLTIDEDRPYVLSDFIHSLSDLSQIDFSKLNIQKSIFSEDFEPSLRTIGNGIDFDLYFEE